MRSAICLVAGVTLLLAFGVEGGGGAEGYGVRFFNVTARDSDAIGNRFAIADEERAQDFLYSQTGLMFRVQSYEPIPFRLAETSDQAASLGKDLSVRIDAELEAAGYSSSTIKNLAFYGGPSITPGLGGSALWPGGTGIVFVGNGGKFVVVVHELFHSFGIVPTCAPHSSGNGHVVDDVTDLMRSDGDPPASGSSAGGIKIDANHDDYFNPTLSSDRKTAVAIGGCPASQNLANMPWVTAGVFPNLHIGIVGDGSVLIGDVGICSQTCDLPKALGTPYTLVPQPSDDWRFVRWGGSCAGSGACTVTMSAAQTVDATFAPNPVEVTVKVVGNGRVKGLLRTGACFRTCSRRLPAGASLHLSAFPARYWRFAGWRGCSRKCVFAASRKTVTAKFKRLANTG